MRISRRDFLKISGVVAAAGALEGKLVFNALEKPEQKAAAASIPVVKHGVCGICEMACAFKGYLSDGTLVKLEGNEKDLHSGGALCAKGNAGVNLLYDPDRLKYPLLRTNPERGLGVDPRWKKISWDEAFNLAAGKLNEIRKQYGPKSIAWIGGHSGVDFLQAIGSPNDICHFSTCYSVRSTACEVTLGVASLVPDLENSAFILSFGWDQFGKGKNAWARALANNLAKGTGKLVVFDPRLSVTASKAHEWIPVRPGTDHAIALAMLNVIIRENLYQHDFVDKYTVGFAELAKAVAPYTPQWAGQISDVPSSTITRLAREFAAAPSACIPIHKRDAIQIRPNGWSLARAILILMSITGNIEKRGGALFPRTMKLGQVKPSTPPPTPETTARIDSGEKFPFILKKPYQGFGPYQVVPDNMLKDQPYPVKALIIAAQGLDSMSDPDKWIKAFRKADFIININIYPDDMATLADLVLPEPTYLEKSAISPRGLNAIYPQLAVGEPMVKPMYDTRPLPAIKTELAKRMGVLPYMPPTGPEAVKAQMAPLGIGTADILKKDGIYSPNPNFVPMDLTQLKTPSKKIELYSEALAKQGYDPLPTHRDEWLIRPGKGEFYLTTTRFAFQRHGKTENLRWLHEIGPENYLYLNADVAGQLGIGPEDMVIVESAYGSIKIKVKPTQGIRPDTVCIPHGYGQHSRFLRLAGGKGANDGDLMPAMSLEQTMKLRDPSAAADDCQVTVRVRKA